jgi:5-methylthioadenosine/S-adenosylhomocysteine deaminase
MSHSSNHVQSSRIVIRGGVVLSMVDSEPPRVADVIIDGPRITDVRPTAPPSPGDQAASILDATGGLVMPGLVNAHTHTPMTLARSTMDGVGFPGPGTPPTMPPGKDWRGRLTPDDLYWASRLAVAEMIRGGTTTFVDMYPRMDGVARTVVETGMRAALGSEITSFRNDPHEWLPYDERIARRSFEESARFASDWHGKGEGRITAWIAPHETSTCHEPWLSRSAKLATELDLGVTLHVAESSREVDFCRVKYGATPVETLERAGILDRRVVGAHSLILTDGDLRILSTARYTAVACLGCSIKLATDLTPVVRLRRAGINVALGTDSAQTNNNLSIWDEIHLNATLHGLLARDPSLLPGDAAIRMATVCGAAALGLDHEIGCIAVGKRADVIVLDLNAPHLLPHEGALIGNLTFSASGHDVRDVLVDGRILMRNRHITAFDEGEVLRQAQAIVRRHRAAVGLPPRFDRP